MNWLIVQFWLSMTNWFHSFSLQLASRPPWAVAATKTGSDSGSRGALAATCSMSTSRCHGRSVSPFHWAPLAFS